MEFKIDMKLLPREKIKRVDLEATGSLTLGAWEGETSICSRTFRIEYSCVRKGKKDWKQTMRVTASDGEEVFSHAGVTSDKRVMERLPDEEMHMKFCIFYMLMSQCVKNNGVLQAPITFEENPPPKAIDLLLRICRGQAH